VEDPQLQMMGVAVQPGATLLGKYRVERVIGVGGMGAVVGARHLQLDERVAIKFLLPEMLANEEIVQRFLREARAAIKIRSEHCVRVLDVGKLENGAPYMVMEFLEGQDLAAVVEKQRPLAVSDVVDWVLQASEALAEAHAIGIVHRDLKPANLFLTRRADGTPSVKVLDFGISKQAASGADAGVTKTQAVLGSPRYMSPEQMRSTKDVDARADVWALGAVVYELVAGVPPFDAETMTALCAAILQDSPRPMQAHRPDVPPELDAAVAGSLEKDRDRRYPNVAHLAAALAPFGSASARASAERIARVLGVQAAMPQGAMRLSQPGGPFVTTGATGRGSLPGVPLSATTGSAAVTTTTAQPRSPTAAIAAAAAVVGVLLIGGGLALVASRARKEHDVHAAAAPSAPPPPAVTAPPPAVSLVPPAADSVAAADPATSASASAPAAAPPPPGRPAPPAGGGRPAGAGGKGSPAAPPPGPKPPANNNSNPFGDDRKG
jgi:tRNA A-37 threonylcarbamoyl transferase component Bud32